MPGFGDFKASASPSLRSVSPQAMREYAKNPAVTSTTKIVELYTLRKDQLSSIRGILLGYFNYYPEIRHILAVDPDNKNLSSVLRIFNADHDVPTDQQGYLHRDILLTTGSNSEVRYSPSDINLINKHLSGNRQLPKNHSVEKAKSEIKNIQKKLGLLNEVNLPTTNGVIPGELDQVTRAKMELHG